MKGIRMKGIKICHFKKRAVRNDGPFLLIFTKD